MSSLAFLVTELQSLASETRRKHPEIREAAEKSLAILRASPDQASLNLALDDSHSDDLLRPVFMGCMTKNAKVVAISLGSLQRLIALKAVPQSAVPHIINTMSDAMSQGVDIQLRILQTLVSLIMNFPAVNGVLLGDALLLCFKLQDSKIAVVSSTAAATLRQLVMFVVDKMVVEDSWDGIPDAKQPCDVNLPDGTTKSLGPSARDAFSVFEDLCLLANSEKPKFLKLEFLHKTFALELIESVLTNYHDLFRKRTELIVLLRHHLCPLLLKALSDRLIFPLTLRCTRVIFLLLKQFSFELRTEAEVFLMLFIKIIAEDTEAGVHPSEPGPHVARPLWMRVLAMEIMRGLCSDAELMRQVWDRYDSLGSGSNVFGSLITALKRLVTEKPALLGICSQMLGVGLNTENTGFSTSGYGLDVGGMAGRVATAASATVSGVVGMMGSSGGLSLQGSAMKLQCIDQLDKADSPPIPDSYIYLLGVQCLVSLCEGFASFTGPLYSSIVIQKPRAAGEPQFRAPSALDLSTLPASDPSAKQLAIVRDIIESCWPAFLAALSFVIATNLSDELFVEILGSNQAMINVSGMLGLTTSRDAFFTSLSKFAVPTRVVSSLESYAESQTPKSTIFSENLGLSGRAQPPGLSERNMACLKVFISSAMFLAGNLGESWFSILEALQNADYVLTSKGAHSTSSRRNLLSPTSGAAPGSRSVPISTSPSQSAPLRHPMLNDLDTETLQNAIQRLFDASKNLEDPAFTHFINALCRLSSEMIGMQSEGDNAVADPDSVEDLTASLSLSPDSQTAHRRRVSGIHIPRTLRSGDFGITKLGSAAHLNIHRLIYRPPNIAWNVTTSHLLSIIRLPLAPQSIRVQAANVLDEILAAVPRNLSTRGDLRAQVQRRVFDVLAQQVVPDTSSPASYTSTSIELRRMGLETLHQILQASGHTLVVGWETIFQMLESVCRPIPPTRSASVTSMSILGSPPSPTSNKGKPLPLGLGNASDKSYTALVKIAFQSLTLVCDSVSSLSPEHLRLCITTLRQFGRQADTNIALTAAASLFWSVSDVIQSKRKNVDEEPGSSALWMFLLLEVLELCTDARPEVRDGAIQTLFRTMQLYGSTLSLETWDQCIWKVTFPLLDSLTVQIRQHAALGLPMEESSTFSVQEWNESKILALHSIGSILQDFLTLKIMQLDSFPEAWDIFVTHIQDTVLLDNRTNSAPALRCLEKAIEASPVIQVKPITTQILLRVWHAIDIIGSAVLRHANGQFPVDIPGENELSKLFTQESLIAFVNVIQTTRQVSRSLHGAEWALGRLTRLMAILKGILTYPNSPDFRPDIDALPPLQAAIMDTIHDIDLSAPGSPSLVLQDLSEYATLAFLAAFDIQTNSRTQAHQKRVTYIALSKRTMPMLAEIFLQFKDNADIYMDGTLESVISAYSIPVKLKYDCPAPSKYNNDLPLWKTATISFLRIVHECAIQMKVLSPNISGDRAGGIWRQILDVFRGGILADCSSAESFSLELQDAEEDFDLALIISLKSDVAPHVGHTHVPDHTVSQLATILHRGSLLFQSESEPDRGIKIPQTSPSQDLMRVKNTNAYELGSSDSGRLVPRERFSYWCFDLLFFITSYTATDLEPSRRRLAVLSLPLLLDRCRTTMVSYVADEVLRGNLPFSRAREHELVYVLRKLLALRLWPGSLWAAMSSNPSMYCVEQPSIDSSMTPSLLIADIIQRSTAAHLFYFYTILCEIASIPRKMPSVCVLSPAALTTGDRPKPESKSAQNEIENESVELDARVLARECLKEIGREMSIQTLLVS